MAVFGNVPLLIRNDQGVAVTFENDWFKSALDRAAHKAGYNGWWLSDEFTEAVTHYLFREHSPDAIELSNLERAVRVALRDVGYGEIAVRFRAVNPFQCVSFIECLKASGENREAAFFRRLAGRIKTLHAAKVRHFHFYDLQRSAGLLVGSDAVSSWSAAPLMRARIVSFVRQRVQALSWQRKVLCTIR